MAASITRARRAAWLRVRVSVATGKENTFYIDGVKQRGPTIGTVPADIVIYHNPSCSKSRGALDILSERDDVEVVNYKANPLDRATIERIVDLVEDPPSALVRKDQNFKELGLDASDYQTRDQVVDLLTEHGILMERPVIIRGDRAVIGRPPERVNELLD
jgi:arsenate reductase